MKCILNGICRSIVAIDTDEMHCESQILRWIEVEFALQLVTLATHRSPFFPSSPAHSLAAPLPHFSHTLSVYPLLALCASRASLSFLSLSDVNVTAPPLNNTLLLSLISPPLQTVHLLLLQLFKLNSATLSFGVASTAVVPSLFYRGPLDLQARCYSFLPRTKITLHTFSPSYLFDIPPHSSS